METKAFFENYRVIILWTESDKKNNVFIEGVRELKKLEQLGRFDLSWFKFDSKIQSNILVNKASETRSIILTSNKDLIDLAKQQNIFTVVIRSGKSAKT